MNVKGQCIIKNKNKKRERKYGYKKMLIAILRHRKEQGLRNCVNFFFFILLV